MPWYILAILSTFLFGIVNFIENYVIDRKIVSPIAMLIIGCFTSGLLGLALLFIFPNLRVANVLQGFLLLVPGVLTVSSWLPYYQALSVEDTSSVVPLLHSKNVFLFILGVIFFKEYLTVKQIIGLLVIIISSLYLGNTHIKQILKPRKSFWLMLSSCLIGAFSIIIFKEITNQYGFWTGIVYTFLGGGVLSILLLCIKRNRQEVLKVNFKKFIPFLLVNDTIDILGRLCYLYAMTLTLVALVEVLTSIQSLVVLLYGIILTLFFPKITKEDIRWVTLKNKIIVALIMFLGMWLVYF